MPYGLHNQVVWLESRLGARYALDGAATDPTIEETIKDIKLVKFKKNPYNSLLAGRYRDFLLANNTYL